MSQLPEYGARRLYRDAGGRIWCGESAGDAVEWASIPDGEDARWLRGLPTVVDVRVLTLGASGAYIECKSSERSALPSRFRAFEGVTHWMGLEQIGWTAYDCGSLLPGAWEDIGAGLFMRQFAAGAAWIEARIYDQMVVLQGKSMHSPGGMLSAARCVSEFRIPYKASGDILEAITTLESRLLSPH